MAPLPILLLMCSMVAPSRPSACPDLPGRAQATGNDGLVSGQAAPYPRSLGPHLRKGRCQAEDYRHDAILWSAGEARRDRVL
jgi:hypothetical protein